MNHQITDLSVVARMPEQVSCDLSGEAVILNLNSGIYYGMDEIGALIWNALDEPRTLEYIRDTILSDYQIDSDTCERDIVAFLAEMQSAGLIEIHHEARV